jgi:hypothetical protein
MPAGPTAAAQIAEMKVLIIRQPRAAVGAHADETRVNGLLRYTDRALQDPQLER